MKVTIQDDGSLLLEVEDDDADLLMREDLGDVDLLYPLLEPYWANGGFEPFDAGAGNPFVGLTSAPCIAESMNVDDDGMRVIVGRFWHYGDYMVKDFVALLRRDGKVVFDLAE
jgi:hypothetical protein